MSDSLISNQPKKKRSVLLARTVFLLAVCGVAAFVLLAVRLYRLQVTDSNYYESQALKNQTGRTTLTASRGTILDTNGKILAMSAAVENVFISPYEFVRDGQNVELITTGLSGILDIPRGLIEEKIKNTESQYQVIKTGVESKQASMVRDFISENNLKGIYFEAATRRYYPNNNLASQVLGFVGVDNYGLDGLEQQYDSLLTGVDGRLVSLRNARGSDLLLSGYDDYFPAQDGNNITLTIDSSIQYYVEKHLAQAVIDYDVLNGATCIAMGAKTGAILALANYPNYDPNNYLGLSDEELEKLSHIEDGAEYAEAFYAAQLRQWRNRSFADTYEPGSVFKTMTLSMAIEENVTSMQDLYYCEGSLEVLGREEDDPLHCWNIYGHGQQTLVEAIKNSCNIASAKLSLQIGAQKFYKYIEAFGLFDKTGLNSSAEGRSLWWDESVFFDINNKSQLASASFGQTFKVTPIQMITAAAATINGGYLMKPYIVQQITDSEGNIIQATEPTVVRQPISSKTSAMVREILEEVVSDGTGKNAQVKGYRVGGKTGTSENVEQLSAEEGNENIVKDYIVSFLGFAPADDPEIIILLLLDTPSNETGLYISGGAMAAPVVGNMLADILPLSLGINPVYSEEDLKNINTDMPRLTGRSISEAQELLAGRGFEFVVEGSGEIVTGQLPAPNAYIASGSRVVLYADKEMPTDPVTVPSISGMSYSAAKQALESRGLFIRTTGAPKSDNRASVFIQSIPAGEETAYGSVVEATLVNKDAVERN